MGDFSESKPFGAACVGLVTFAVGYYANLDTLALMIVALLMAVAYWSMIHYTPD
jgi:hypothetical protein